jgi:putative membrane protein
MPAEPTNPRSTLSPGAIHPFSQRRLLHFLLLVLAISWSVAALNPTNRLEWAEANIPIACLLTIIAITYKLRPLSDVSYLLLTAFLLLAIAGSHFTYQQMPTGTWMALRLGISRNPYDRVVHFSVGLLLAYPVKETLRSILETDPPWTYFLPVVVFLAASSLWEIFEVFYGIDMHSNGNYVGSNGDPFDSQHDMACALAGSIVSMALTAAFDFLRRPRTS